MNARPVLSRPRRPSLNARPVLSRPRRPSVNSRPVLSRPRGPSVNSRPVLSRLRGLSENPRPVLLWFIEADCELSCSDLVVFCFVCSGLVVFLLHPWCAPVPSAPPLVAPFLSAQVLVVFCPVLVVFFSPPGGLQFPFAFALVGCSPVCSILVGFSSVGSALGILLCWFIGSPANSTSAWTGSPSLPLCSTALLDCIGASESLQMVQYYNIFLNNFFHQADDLICLCVWFA